MELSEHEKLAEAEEYQSQLARQELRIIPYRKGDALMVDNQFEAPARDDLELVYSAIRIDANLHYALHASLLAKRHLKFPVRTVKELAPLFTKATLLSSTLGRKISLADAKRIMTKEYFPIASPDDFLAKAYHCLSKGDMSHYLELIAKHPQRAYPTVLINLNEKG